MMLRFYIQLIVCILTCCYVYEQLFYEVMIGRLQSTHRSLEFILILTGIGYCFGVPLYLLWKKRSYWQGRLIPFGIGHVAAIIFLILVSFTDLGQRLGRPLQVDSQLQKVDAIVICDMGNFHIRSTYAAQLFHQGMGYQIVSFAPKRREFQDFLKIHLQVPSEAIINGRPPGKFNTYLEAKNLRKMMNAQDWQRILIVTDPFNMLRTIKTLEKAGVKGVHPASIPDSIYTAQPARYLGKQIYALSDISFDNLSPKCQLEFRHKMMMDVFHEYMGIPFYFLMGYL